MLRAFLLALLLSQPSAFTLVNGTRAPLEDIRAKLTNGQGDWRPLGPGRLSPGARGAVAPLGGEDCAFDVEARSGPGVVRWSGVNLCDVRVVVLNQAPDGTPWAEYR